MTTDTPASVQAQRYWKFVWDRLDSLPPVGKIDYQPKGGSIRMYQQGEFNGEYLETFSAIKHKRKLKPFGRCVYCNREKAIDGTKLVLSSEHVIPEFLGAGLELPKSSCADCQVVTSEYESSIAQEMFDPVRKSFSLSGKSGTIAQSNFPLDVGRETTSREFIALRHYPTILILPQLYPASSYSRRPKDADDLFNFMLYNINADMNLLKQYNLDRISSQHIDLVRFCQMVAKIAHVYAMQYLADRQFLPTLAGFIRTSYPRATAVSGHLEHVGCLLGSKEKETENLHEIEVGKITWNSETFHAVRVRLFASYKMPSYYVTVGKTQA